MATSFDPKVGHHQGAIHQCEHTQKLKTVIWRLPVFYSENTSKMYVDCTKVNSIIKRSFFLLLHRAF